MAHALISGKAPEDAAQGESPASSKKDSKSAKTLGFIGVLLTMALVLLCPKVLLKKCAFCQRKVGDPDELLSDHTMSWNKPDYQGRVCAYCGSSKLKLHPHRDVAEVLTLVATKDKENERFFAYRTFLIEQHLAGNKAARAIFPEPRQTVEKQNEFNMIKRDKGTMMLLSAYIEEKGDPLTNGLGHYKTTTTWKDGSQQEVVLIGTTRECEMECEWEYKSGFRHNTMLDDGKLTHEAGQQASLFRNLRADGGASLFAGKRAAPASLPAETQQPPRGLGAGAQRPGPAVARHVALAGAAFAAAAADDEDDRASDGVQPRNLLSMFDDGVSSASAPSRPQVQTPKRAGKAKAKAGNSGMPPSLASLAAAARGGGGARGGGRGACGSGGPSEAGVSKLMTKAVSAIQEWESFPREQFANKGKAYYKQLSELKKNLEAHVQLVTEEKEEEINLFMKHLGMIVDYTKAYKAWLKSADDQKYLSDIKATLDFGKRVPPAELQLPICIKVDEVEINFLCGLDQPIDESGMLVKWETLSKSALQNFMASDEVDAAQVRIVEAALSKMLNGRPIKVEDVPKLHKRLWVFVQPLGPLSQIELTEIVDNALTSLRFAVEY